MASTYHHDYAAFGRIVLNGDFMVAHLLGIGELVKGRAEVTAPYDAEDPDLIHYRDHFGVRAGKHGGIHHDRAYVEIYNDDMPTARFVEWGTKNNPRHRTLGNALDAASGG